MLSSSGSSRSSARPACVRARRSLGRHEPPNANPGVRYAVEMLSFVSAQNTSITSCESIPSALHSAPISLANEIFAAWKALSAYLTISATRSGTRNTGARRCS